MMLLRFLFLLMFSLPAFAISTWQQAMDQCLAPLPPGGGGNYCVTHYETDICGVTLASGASGYIRREWEGFTAFCSTSNSYVFGDDGCSDGMQREAITGICTCPSGQVEDGNGGCMVQPPECASEQLGFACGSQICTGSYVPSFSCFITSPPSGCEAGTQTFNGCDLVCLGQSTPNASGTACDDPVCSGAEHLENHSCVADPTCVGGQVPNSETHTCDEPTCTDNHTLNTETHICEFSGCPVGTVQTSYDGSTISCVKSGQTTSGTQESSTTTTGTNSGTTTTNQDGSQTTVTTTSNTSTSNSTISLDTGGLAQESTQAGILAELKKGNEGKSFGGTAGGSQYEPTEKTYGGVLMAFKDRVTASPIASAGSIFFTITLSGSCPIWVLPQTALTPAIPIDMQCSDMMNDIWPLISAVVIAAASFMAFRWAFL
jgi:hypothetical protein